MKADLIALFPHQAHLRRPENRGYAYGCAPASCIVPLITVLQQEIVTLTAASGMALDLAIVIRRAGSVLNNNNFLLEDGYNGVRYTFAPGKALTIPVEAAKHIFDWDELAPCSISFPHVERRWGWNTRATAPHAKEWFKNIIVRPVYIETIEIVSMPHPEHKPRSSSPERKRELTRQRVSRLRARQKALRAAAEGRRDVTQAT